MQIAIVVYPGMTALDAIGPYEVLRGVPECDLRFVWKEVGPIVTDSGVLVIGATHDFGETPRPDVLLVPGSGPNTPTMMADGELLAWIRQAHVTTRFTTSACSGSAILAAAGLLEGVPATSHWAAFPLLQAYGVKPRPNERVVRSGKLFTAAGVSAGIDMALSLLAELTSVEHAQATQLAIEYDPKLPFDAGHMSKASAPVASLARKEMQRVAVNRDAILALPTLAAQRFKQMLHRIRLP